MAEKKKKKRGGRRCVAGAPNNTTCGNNSRTPGISMHQFPKNEKTRALWVRFVQRHRSDFDEPVNQYAVLLGANIKQYEVQFAEELIQTCFPDRKGC